MREYVNGVVKIKHTSVRINEIYFVTLHKMMTKFHSSLRKTVMIYHVFTVFRCTSTKEIHLIIFDQIHFQLLK